MQDIVSEKPYRFVAPQEGRFWPSFFNLFLRSYLNREHGVCAIECRGTEHLVDSLQAQHGIVLAPNHCRPCDPLVLGVLAQAVGRPFYTMASAHLFMRGGFQAWLLPRIGAFSVYREGMDREALKTAIEILKEARRPLVLFPEGVVSRTNDRLNHLQDGIAFIARSAAKQRVSEQVARKVVVHPVALRYVIEGGLPPSVLQVLEALEARLSWASQRELPLAERIIKVGDALLSLKEIEHIGQLRTGEIKDRLAFLIDHLLTPLEHEWLGGQREAGVVARVKRLRSAILPDMVAGEITESERARRWTHLAKLYLAQQLSFYPPDYIKEMPIPERIMETIERFEEDLTDRATVHRPLRVVIQVGPAIEVSPVRDKHMPDQLMPQVREQLERLLTDLGATMIGAPQ